MRPRDVTSCSPEHAARLRSFGRVGNGNMPPRASLMCSTQKSAFATKPDRQSLWRPNR
jgi:hypothetical protein